VAYSVTYDYLRDVAAETVGKDRAHLTDSELTRINNAPNAAVELAGRARDWPFLVKEATLSTAAAQAYVLLPTDFEAFDRDDAVTYSGATWYPPIRRTSIGELRALQAGAETSGYPRRYAFGPVADSGANDGRYQLMLWPTPDAVYSYKTSYRRTLAAMSAGGDAPDLPGALHRAVEIATRMEALRMWLRPITTELRGEFEEAVHQAAKWLMNPTPQEARALRTLRRVMPGLPTGRNMSLADDYFD